MTGYSRVQSEEGGSSLAVSIKSTNHRFLDLQIRLPAALESLDPLVRRLVKERVTRGRVEITVSLERAGQGELRLNRKLLGAFVTACRELQAEFGLTAEPDPATLLRIPGVVTLGNGDISPQELERLQALLERVTAESLERLNAMRTREGEILERDLSRRLNRLGELTENIGKLAAEMPLGQRRRLESRLQEMLGSVQMDEARLAQEIAYLASRSDVTEELTRLRSHLDQAKHLLQESSEVGKKLDFLLQEMNREANTLLSKTTDAAEAGLGIPPHAIEMKTEIEKLREQAQNIE